MTFCNSATSFNNIISSCQTFADPGDEAGGGGHGEGEGLLLWQAQVGDQTQAKV